MDKLFHQMLARTKRVAASQKALRLEVLRAVGSLSRLSGFPPHDTLENLQMGDLAYAIKIKQMYAPGILDQARITLDASQGLEYQDNCDPITPSFDYGQTKKEMLKRISLMTFNREGTRSGRLYSSQVNHTEINRKPPKKDKL